MSSNITETPPPQTPRQRKWSLARFQFPTTKNKYPDAEDKQATSSNPLARTKTIHEKPTPPWLEARRASAAAAQQQETATDDDKTNQAPQAIDYAKNNRRASNTSLDPMESATDDPSSSKPPDYPTNTPALSAAYQNLQTLPNALAPDNEDEDEDKEKDKRDHSAAAPPSSSITISPPTRAPTRRESKAAARAERDERQRAKRSSEQARRASRAMEKDARRASAAAQRELEMAQADLRDWEWHNEKCGCDRFQPRTGGGCRFAVLKGGAGAGGGEF